MRCSVLEDIGGKRVVGVVNSNLSEQGNFICFCMCPVAIAMSKMRVTELQRMQLRDAGHKNVGRC